jgi:hypothetical protein
VPTDAFERLRGTHRLGARGGHLLASRFTHLGCLAQQSRRLFQLRRLGVQLAFERLALAGNLRAALLKHVLILPQPKLSFRPKEAFPPKDELVVGRRRHGADEGHDQAERRASEGLGGRQRFRVPGQGEVLD